MEQFTPLAQKLLNESLLIINGHKYRLIEIEFYLCSEEHKDEYTHKHPDQATTGHFYFHRVGKKYKPGMGYKGGTFKGVDLTLGSKDCYYGVLIRGLQNMETGKYVIGPSKSVDEILERFDIKSKSIVDLLKRFDTKLISTDNELLGLVDCEPMNHQLWTGPRIGLRDTYPEFWKSHYRYVSDKKAVKKDKNSLVELAKKNKKPVIVVIEDEDSI